MNSNKFTYKARTFTGVMAVFILVIALMAKLKNKKISAYGTDRNSSMLPKSKSKTISVSAEVEDHTTEETFTTIKTTPIEVPVISVGDRLVHYTPRGKSYHYSRSCRALARSKIISQCKLSDVIKLGKTNPCYICVK